MPNGQTHSKRSHEHHSDRNNVRTQLRDRAHSLSKPIIGIDTDKSPTLGDSDELLSSSADALAQNNNEHLTYYPAYCHKASPTWFEWVKLTAHDVHTKLHTRDGYQHSWSTEYRFARDAPQMMFYLNHPIQFVQVVGVVVSFDEYFDRFWLFTIDDSSGLTIDVVCRKPTKDKLEATQSGISTLNEKSEDEKDAEKEITQLSNLVIRTVELGAVLQVKGVITLFRRGGLSGRQNDLKHNGRPDHMPKEEPVRQISLQRLSKIHDTNQEIGLIAARTKFYNSVLARPWTLSKIEQENLHKEALGEVEHDKKRTKRAIRKRQRLIEMEKEVAAEIQQEYEREEESRIRDSEAAREAGEKLKESLKHERVRPVDKMPPKVDRLPENTISDGLRDRDKSKGHKQGEAVTGSGCVKPAPESHEPDTTNDSFGPLEDEKSALLRLAFG